MEAMEEIQQLINLEAIKKLPVEKKRAIIDVIEETIEYDYDYSEGIPEDYEEEETEEELQIIEGRLREYEANPNDVASWDDFLKEYRAGKK